MAYELKLFSGNAKRALAEEIARLCSCRSRTPSSRGSRTTRVFVQDERERARARTSSSSSPTCPPVNDT
jgi:hypothetical protein